MMGATSLTAPNLLTHLINSPTTTSIHQIAADSGSVVQNSRPVCSNVPLVGAILRYLDMNIAVQLSVKVLMGVCITDFSGHFHLMKDIPAGHWDLPVFGQQTIRAVVSTAEEVHATHASTGRIAFAIYAHPNVKKMTIALLDTCVILTTGVCLVLSIALSTVTALVTTWSVKSLNMETATGAMVATVFLVAALMQTVLTLPQYVGQVEEHTCVDVDKILTARMA